MIIVHAKKCKLCGDTIFSRTSHDFRRCTCQNLFVDGGPALTDTLSSDDLHSFGRIGFVLEDSYQTEEFIIDDISSLNLEEVSNILYKDWNENINKYGLIKDNSYTQEQVDIAKAKVELIRCGK